MGVKQRGIEGYKGESGGIEMIRQSSWGWRGSDSNIGELIEFTPKCFYSGLAKRLAA